MTVRYRNNLHLPMECNYETLDTLVQLHEYLFTNSNCPENYGVLQLYCYCLLVFHWHFAVRASDNFEFLTTLNLLEKKCRVRQIFCSLTLEKCKPAAEHSRSDFTSPRSDFTSPSFSLNFSRNLCLRYRPNAVLQKTVLLFAN